MTKKDDTKPLGRPMVEIDHNRVIELTKQGLTDKQLASELGISRQTLHNRKKSDPKLLEAYQAGEAAALAAVEKTLFKLALDGDAGACKFILSTRRRETYTTRQEVANAEGESFRMDVKPLTPDERKAAVIDITRALNDET